MKIVPVKGVVHVLHPAQHELNMGAEVGIVAEAPQREV